MNVRYRGPEGGLFRIDVLRFSIWYRFQIGKRIEQRDGADCHTARRLYPLDECILLHLPTQHPVDFVDGRSLVNRSCNLGRNGHEKSHLVLIELAMYPFPSREHAQDALIVDQWHADKAAVTFFACFRRYAVARVSRGIRQNDQFPAFHDQTHEALRTHTELAY